MVRRLFALLALTVMTVACAQKEADLLLSEQSGVLDYRAGSWLTMVTSGGDWTLSPDASYDWITPSRLQGGVGNIITFTVQANLTGSSRSALYRIQSGSQNREISILQEPKPDPVLPPSKGAYKHVVILGVDGGGDFFKNTYTPNMDAIFADGATTYEWRAVSPSISAQNWGSMLHGVMPEFHRLTNQIAGSRPYPADSPYPSIFRLVREAMPGAVLASICNWSAVNIGIIEDGIGVEKWNEANDPAVAAHVVGYLQKNDPTLLFVHFDSCDAAGHGNGYGSAQHLAAVSAVDGLIGEIYAVLEQRNLLDDTLFMVVTDHGGTPGGSHGGNSDAEMIIFFGAAGKTVDWDNPIEDGDNRDIAAIAAYALGLEIPEAWTSRVPTGVFWDVTGGGHKTPEIPVSPNRRHQTEDTPPLTEVQRLLKDHEVMAYLPLDNSEADAFGKLKTMPFGKLYYYDAYYGKGVALDDGYITLEDLKVGTGSFSVAFWVKTNGVTGDPCFLCNKDWQSGLNDGFVFSLRESDIKFNAGGKNKTERMDVVAALPMDYKEGWMHVILVVDREKQQVRIYEDFGLEGWGDIPAALWDVSFDALPLRIGQDGMGTYGDHLAAQLDEFILTADVLSDEDIVALRTFYQASEK